MRNLTKGLLMSATFILAFSFATFAQTTTEKSTKPGRPDLNLSETQKAQMKANQEAGKANREKFEATFSKEQKAIMEDKTLKPRERMEKLNETLNADQKAMYKANRDASKASREAFQSTLTPEQKDKMEKMRAQHGEKGKGQRDGKGRGAPRPVKKQ